MSTPAQQRLQQAASAREHAEALEQAQREEGEARAGQQREAARADLDRIDADEQRVDEQARTLAGEYKALARRLGAREQGLTELGVSHELARLRGDADALAARRQSLATARRGAEARAAMTADEALDEHDQLLTKYPALRQ